MKAAGSNVDEERRLAVLREYQLLDTPPEALYDSFTRLAAEIAGTPIALVSLIDRDRQWFKSRVGLEATSTPRDQAFCAHAIAETEPFVVQDAVNDTRFAGNPLVTGDPNIRFYAGYPLRSPEGFGLGTLCVIDREPRELTMEQHRALRQLSYALRAVLDDRRDMLQIFDAAYNELFSYDPGEKTFIFASRGALTMLGYTMAELRSLPLEAVFTDLSGTRYEIAMRTLRDDRPFVGECLARRKDGELVPVELHAGINRSGGRERIFIVAVNVSERHAAQEQLDLLLSAINVAGDSIVVYEVVEGELRLAYANFAFYQQTGYDRSDIMGKPLNWFRRGMPDDPGMMAVRNAITTGTAAKTEVCSYRKDGRSFWNQVTLQPIRSTQGEVRHWISVERDVTDAVERESNLEDQNARLVALGRAARELIGALSATALTARFKQSVKDLTGATARIASLAAELPPDPLLVRAAAENATVKDGDTRMALPAGNGFIAEIRSQRPLRDADRLVIELLVQYYAVASRNASLVGEIEDQRNAVLELNQIKTDLIAMLAHDFKGPLTNILGYADLTAEMGDLNDHQQEYLESIKRAALRLADLATDTLSLSRLERNEIEIAHDEVDLVNLLRDVVVANDRRKIDLEIEGDAIVRGDLRRLRQVFYNLVENAIKYSPEGQPVTVRVSVGSTHARIQVIDRGIGIPAAEVARVFDRFSRAANARRLRIPGTGFGLFLAHQIVEMHGGTIAVESVEGEGSTFSVTLPVSGAGHLTRPLRVAVIEGKNESRSFITHALREAGLRTRVHQSVQGLTESGIFETDRIVLDSDALSLDEEAGKALVDFAQHHDAKIVVVGSDPPELGGRVVALKKPYLMRDLVAAVQTGSVTRPGAA
ncbi:MAG TPA: ATP-binding protein [Candidatus Baltobacteraceae bacterium]|nr:ATP-binding protein [Candidatus Baltobacteraceae bacterium]